MKSDKNGCSTCPDGEERTEIFSRNGKEYVQYDHRTPDGTLFSCVAPSLEVARQKYANWLLHKLIGG